MALVHIRVLVGGLFLLFVSAMGLPAPGQEAKNNNTKSIDFKTADGVTIQGTFYPNPSGKRDAVVILLHDFDLKKGGKSQDEGWSDLALALQKDGYAVLQFDFRGFGESKEIDPDLFWKQQSSSMVRRRSAKVSTTIDHKDFMPRYIPYLVNDIAAAKAYLDRQNDQRNCNTSSVIVIGAGEGATLGALWMANETRRRRDKNPVNPLIPQPPILGDPESRDLASGVWLTISPRLGGVPVSGPLQKFIVEVGKENKIPQAFLFGKLDGQGDTFSRSLFKSIGSSQGSKKDARLTGIMAIPDSKLTGHKLLGK
ncbi:MAG: alpha/beta hydrolase family protein, partial [Gemmataceae bacterium]